MFVDGQLVKMRAADLGDRQSWGPVGELRAWLRAEDGWWGLVAGRDGVRSKPPKISASPDLCLMLVMMKARPLSS